MRRAFILTVLLSFFAFNAFAGEYYKITGGNGNGTGPVVIKNSTGQQLGTLNPGNVIQAFNVTQGVVTFAFRGRIGQIASSMVTKLSGQEVGAAQSQEQENKQYLSERLKDMKRKEAEKREKMSNPTMIP